MKVSQTELTIAENSNRRRDLHIPLITGDMLHANVILWRVLLIIVVTQRKNVFIFTVVNVNLSVTNTNCSVLPSKCSS